MFGAFTGSGTWGVSTLTRNARTGKINRVTLFETFVEALNYARKRAKQSGRAVEGGSIYYIAKFRDQDDFKIKYRVLRSFWTATSITRTSVYQGRKGPRTFSEQEEVILVQEYKGKFRKKEDGPEGEARYGERWKTDKKLSLVLGDPTLKE